MTKNPVKKPKKSSEVAESSALLEENSRKIEDNKKRLLRISQSSFHQGPLPTPEDLYRYDQICHGAADRIIRMAEREQKSLHKFRIKEYRSLRLGMIFGFISLLCLMTLTAVALYFDKPWVATVLIAVVSTCGLLVTRKKASNDNVDE